MRRVGGQSVCRSLAVPALIGIIVWIESAPREGNPLPFQEANCPRLECFQAGGFHRSVQPAPPQSVRCSPAKSNCFRLCHALYAFGPQKRSEEHTSELQSLMRNSYAGFCFTKKTRQKKHKQ